MTRTDQVFAQWRKRSVFFRPTDQRGARAVQREHNDSTLDKIWGLKPEYTGKVIRRKAA